MGNTGQKNAAPVIAQITTSAPFTTTYASRCFLKSAFFFSLATALARVSVPGFSPYSLMLDTSSRRASDAAGPVTTAGSPGSRRSKSPTRSAYHRLGTASALGPSLGSVSSAVGTTTDHCIRRGGGATRGSGGG